MTRPNAVVIMTDDQRLSDQPFMPRTNALIGGAGTRFGHCYSPLSICAPSRAALLTGQHAHNNGVWENDGAEGGYKRLAHQHTLPVWLQAVGYRTGHVGKYLNGYPPPFRSREIPLGYTEWHGTTSYEAYRFYNWEANRNGTLVSFGDAPEDYQTDVLTGWAVDLINQWGTSTPFFLTVNYLAPHTEYYPRLFNPIPPPIPAPRHVGMFANEPFPVPPSYDEADVSDKPAYVRNEPRLSAGKLARMPALYRARLESLQSVDEGVEAIIQALSGLGILDNTLVVFVSDNGYLLGEHRLEGKHVPYEESSRIPLLVRGPGVVAGQTRQELVAPMDVAATVAELAGATPTRTVDGRSLVPLLSGQSPSWRDAMLLEGPDRAYAGVHVGNRVYVEHAHGETETYDLVADPYQLQSLPADPVLAARLVSMRNCVGGGC